MECSNVPFPYPLVAKYRKRVAARRIYLQIWNICRLTLAEPVSAYDGHGIRA
jgi:hypothetical protein